ncbi:1-deoxy-D-xylulose-5-phosphate synthase [Streptomyces sp. NPDC088846]|uniref:1-deoxy-D-xylulose-5-phosphate synthase n=1 Tax=Streptomyces sp. NPDC088846 TaxID=3365908 RepID=UPI003827F2B3
MALLDVIQGPRDLDRLGPGELEALAGEIREFLIEAVSRTGGHLGPNLGMVELTIGLHRVFHSPQDRLIFDTGHQAYVHKLLTGRQDFSKLLSRGGISGYPSRAESEHDLVENSHASTALGWADGLTKAREVLSGPDDTHVVAVVGDGALTGGMAWEALNNIAAGDRPLIIVVNDNERSYAPTAGGLARHLTALRTNRGPVLFEELGMAYVGPVDGHDIGAVESALRHAKRSERPIVVHCLTQKGRGYGPAERDETDRYHAVSPLHPATGLPVAPPEADWTSVFGAEMLAIGAEREDVVAVTAAMLQPTGLEPFARAYPGRVYDVGIAEQHAATSAAGLAAGGLHPVVALYATFLNRAFDQVLLDVALHRCAVTFVLDRAGVCGNDGASFNGMWDLSILQLVPGLRIAAPRDTAELRRQLREALAVEDGPTAVRFARGTVGPAIPAVGRVGGMDVLRSPEDSAPDVLIVSVGSLAPMCLEAADLLAERGVSATVVDPRWVKPLDRRLPELASRHRAVVTVEDNGRTGGVGSAVSQALRDAGVHVPQHDLGIPQQFLGQASREEVLAGIGLTAPDVAGHAAALLARDSVMAPGSQSEV